MWMTDFSTLTLPVSRSSVSSAHIAHPKQPVGFLAVDGREFGGRVLTRPRTNGFIDGMQQVECVYGTPVLTAQGAKSLASGAPASGKGSGVPPRGRPV
jgi:hypothetical protein